MDTSFTPQVVDLFCGGSGAGSGVRRAFERFGIKPQLIGINHWKLAVETSQTNYPEDRFINSKIEDVSPLEVVPSGRVHCLWASPTCVFHSNARGGRPSTDQQRASPMLILDWLEQLDVDMFIIENVPELRKWGPINHKTGKPIKAMEGKMYVAYLEMLKALGYFISERVVNCADFGDATSRKRLFILGSKHKQPVWPEPTHSKKPARNMFNETLKPWVPAAEIIDWSDLGSSIYTRKKPLVPSTIRKIETGMKRYIGQPFVIGQQSGSTPRSVDNPVPTIAQAGAISLVTTFLLELNHGPNDHRPRSLNIPINTITTVDATGIVAGFLVEFHSGDHRVRPITVPLATQDTSNRFALTTGFAIQYNNNVDAVSLDQPLPTLTASGEHFGLCSPYLVKYNGTGTIQSLLDPLQTVTTIDRFGLASPLVFELPDHTKLLLDIYFRMLHPRELALAMSFPRTYWFAGTREDTVRQIGNSVPVYTAENLTYSMLINHKELFYVQLDQPC